MKRTFFIVAAVVFLLPVLLLPAMAAESYEFFPVGSTLNLDAEFSNYNELQFVYDGLLPEGEYYFTCDFHSDFAYTSIESDIFTVTFGPSPIPDYDAFFNTIVHVSSSLHGGFECDVSLAYVGDFTGAMFFDPEDWVDMTKIDNVVLHRVSEDDEGLFSFITTDMMDLALGQVVTLVPVVFTVIVAYIGIRKAISWLQGVLHNS